MLAQDWGKADVQRREAWLKMSQAKSVGILWITVSTWPVTSPLLCTRYFTFHYFANKVSSSQSYDFSSSYVCMWELDYKESWVPKNWCFWTVMKEKTLEDLLDCKEIQPVNPKGYQSWVFIGKTDVETETAIIWPPYAKTWLISKDPDAGKYWSQEEKQMTEDEMVEWHHWLNAHEFE